MLDVMTALRAMVSLPFRDQVSAVMSQVYLLNGHLCGDIHGDKEKRFLDGTRIISSRINFGFEVFGQRIFLTQSGSIYLVASWRSFDELWAGLDFSEVVSPVDLMFPADPERQPDFENDIELATGEEVALIKVGLPNQRRQRSIAVVDETLIDHDQTTSERNSQIFQLALQLDRGHLENTLESVRETFMAQAQTKVLIECTRRMPDPHLLPLLTLGYLPEWQSILVLDGQFNVSQKATDHLAISLLTVLPTDVLADELRDLRFQIDLGV